MSPALLVIMALAQAPEMAPPPPVNDRLTVPADGAMIALADASANQDTAQFYRYIWVQDNSEEVCNAVDLSVNMALSRNSVPVRGVRLSDHRVLRYDLTALAGDSELELKKLIGLWELFSQDEPYFLQNGPAVEIVPIKSFVIVEASNAKIRLGNKVLGEPKVGTKLEILDDTKVDEHKWFKVPWQDDIGWILSSQVSVKEEKQNNKLQELRTFGPHIPREAVNLLTLCKSQVPIVRAEYAIRKMLDTQEGGLYYDFRGIRKAPKGSKISDLEFFLKSFAGVTEFDVRDLGSNSKAAMIRSKVTGKPRAIIMFSGHQARVKTNQGLVALTQDMSSEDTDVEADPTQNLERHKFVGIEAFVEMPNGQIAYALFAGDFNGDKVYDPEEKNDGGAGEGDLVLVVPDDIASDHEIPSPHPKRLRSAISCIRCHSKIVDGEEQEGWRDFSNDVNSLLKRRTDAFGERKDAVPSFDRINKLAGQYSGSFDKPLSRARDDLAEATTRLTGEVDGEHSVVTTLHQRISKLYREYWYDLVTPEKACYELGFRVGNKEAAVILLNKLLPDLPSDELGIKPEDGRIALLKDGFSLNRFQWDEVYVDAAYRSINSLMKNKGDDDEGVQNPANLGDILRNRE